MKRLNYLCLVGLLFVSAASAARGGSVEWVRQLGTIAEDPSRGVSADGLGNVYISGYTGGSLGGPNAGDYNAFVSKYDAAGTLQWSRQLGTPSTDVSNGVSADGLGNVYISGSTSGSLGGPNAGNQDAFVSKYDAAGTLQWSRQLGTSSLDQSYGVSADGLGNVYVSGQTRDSLGGAHVGVADDAFVSKYDAAGTLQWTRQLGTSVDDESHGVSADGLGNVYISGRTIGSLGGPNAGSYDAFVSKYDAAGILQWSQQLGTSSIDESNGVSADGLGNIYFSGRTIGSLGGPTAGDYDAFVAKISDPAVPEPSTFLFAATALGLCITQRRRRAHDDNPNASRQTRRRQQLSIALVLGLSATLCNSAATAHAATLRTVALTGQQAPGALDGTVFRSFNGMSLVLNDAGQTAFQAAAFTSDYFGGIWSEGGGSLELVAGEGQQAPGLPEGVTYREFPPHILRIVINDAGSTAFSGSFSTGGLGFSSSGAGGSALIARNGDQAAGTPAGVVYSIYDGGGIQSLVMNDAGQTAFWAGVTGPGVDSSNSRGVWAQRHGGLELVARTGNHAPGTPDGVNFGDIFLPGGPALNGLGQTAFSAYLTGPGVAFTNAFGIWSEGSGSLALVARDGSQAPGMPNGAVFLGVGGASYTLTLNAAGQTAFSGRVTGAGVDSTNDRGIWSEASGSLALVVRSGTPAPGTPSGVNFANFANSTAPALNDAGQIAFFATLTGVGVDSTNNVGLWSGASDSPALVARTGEHAPGTEDGVVFGRFTTSTFFDTRRTIILNAAGQTAIYAQLTGSGISASNDLGIWASDRSGALQLIAREGDLLEVAPGDFRTMSFLTFLGDGHTYSTGNSDGRPSAFNNLGQLAFQASFTDGSSGIFVSNRVAIPEPSTFLLAAAAFAGLLLPRRAVRSRERRTLIIANQHSSGLAEISVD